MNYQPLYDTAANEASANPWWLELAVEAKHCQCPSCHHLGHLLCASVGCVNHHGPVRDAVKSVVDFHEGCHNSLVHKADEPIVRPTPPSRPLRATGRGHAVVWLGLTTLVVVAFFTCEWTAHMGPLYWVASLWWIGAFTGWLVYTYDLLVQYLWPHLTERRNR